MSAYRLYGLDGAGHIQLAEWIDGISDEDAVSKARKSVPGARLREVWLKSRLVAQIRNNGVQPA